MPLQLERIANINAVILFGAKSHILFEKTCLNQLWTKGLNHVEPNPRCVGVKEVRIAAPNKFIARVTRHIDQAFRVKEGREMRGPSDCPSGSRFASRGTPGRTAENR